MSEPRDAGGEARKAEQRLFERIYAFYDVKVLAVSLSLGLFEALGAGPRTAEALAGEVGASARGVRGLLLGLSTLGVVTHEGGRYALSDLGRRCFLRGGERYLGGAVEFAEWQFDALPRLAEAVRDDAIVWEGFEHYISGAQGAESDEARRRQAKFNEGLAAGAEGTAKAVMAKVDLSGARRLLDVGGNVGVFAAALLRRHPGLKATVFDLPQVARQVNEDVRGFGLGDRLDALGGDFLAGPLPAGYDLISFIRVLNSRTDETCLALLRKAFDALPPGGRCLFYEEHVLPEDPNDFPPGALWGAMFMLISSPGELRPLSRWQAFFERAGFANVVGVRGRQSGIVIGERP
ncbi:MAG TPA: methyltransferase [Polyangiaceae bacterium]|nr:methyltransferase [Polyangiaceae bacterium]